MASKLTPVKITLVAGVLTLISTIQKRSEILVLNSSGADLGITVDPAGTFATSYPVGPAAEFVDSSNSKIYAISVLGGDIWVWETDV